MSLFDFGKKKNAPKEKTEQQLQREKELKRIEEELKRIEEERHLMMDDGDYDLDGSEEDYDPEDPEILDNKLFTFRFFVNSELYRDIRIRYGNGITPPPDPHFDDPRLAFRKWYPSLAYVANENADYHALYTRSDLGARDDYLYMMKDVYLGFNIVKKDSENYIRILFFYEDSNFSGIIVIPETICGLPVKSIAPGAFKKSQTLTGISFPKNLVTIGAEAFKDCHRLVRLSFSEGQKAIQAGAFAGCSTLALVKLPDSLERIDEGAFLGCDLLHSITLPSGVKTGENVFSSHTTVNRG